MALIKNGLQPFENIIKSIIHDLSVSVPDFNKSWLLRSFGCTLGSNIITIFRIWLHYMYEATAVWSSPPLEGEPYQHYVTILWTIYQLTSRFLHHVFPPHRAYARNTHKDLKSRGSWIWIYGLPLGCAHSYPLIYSFGQYTNRIIKYWWFFKVWHLNILHT